MSLFPVFENPGGKSVADTGLSSLLSRELRTLVGLGVLRDAISDSSTLQISGAIPCVFADWELFWLMLFLIQERERLFRGPRQQCGGAAGLCQCTRGAVSSKKRESKNHNRSDYERNQENHA